MTSSSPVICRRRSCDVLPTPSKGGFGLKRLDRLVIGELLGPWAFGVAIFTVLVIAATSLLKVSDFIIQGVSSTTVATFFMLILPGVMVKTFTMSTLLAALLAFGRLSSDSEIIAMRACGADIYRIVRPVFLFSIGVALVSFLLNETLVPMATQQRAILQAEIAKTLDIKATQAVGIPLNDKGKLVGYLVAQDSDLRRGILRGITVIAYNEQHEATHFLVAGEASFDMEKFQKTGAGWAIRGGAKIVPVDGSGTLVLSGDAWPSTVPEVNVKPGDLLVNKTNDPDMFSIRELVQQMDLAAQDPTFEQGKYVNLQFWLWNKFALPLAAIVFGLLGAPLGIRNARTGAATGFAIAVAIIFGYFMLVNILNTFAMGGVMPASVASFTPLVIGTAFAVFIMWRRNQ